MDERRLAVFVEVARQASFSRAAASLHVSQPAVSQQIAALEAELGARLLERNRRSVRLTEAGKEVLARAEPLLRDLRELRRAVTATAGLVAGDLRVAASLTIGDYVLPPVLGHFGRRYPRVRVRVTMENTERVGRSLVEDRADLGFIEGPLTLAGVQLRPFRQDELVVIAAAEHRWARLSSVPPAELVEEPLILREPGSGTRQVMEDHLRAAAIDPARLRVVMELSGIEAIKTAVAAGVGVSVMSRSAVANELRLGLLIARPVRGVPMWRTLATATATNRLLSPAARELARLAREWGGAPPPL